MQRDHLFVVSTIQSLQKRTNFTPSICTLTWRRTGPSRTARFAVPELTNKLKDIATSDENLSSSADDKSQLRKDENLPRIENPFAQGGAFGNDGASENTGADQMQDTESLGGSLLSDSSDKNFLDALSKGWDDLAQFDPDHIPPEPEEQTSVDSTDQVAGEEQDVQPEPEVVADIQEEEVVPKKRTKKRGRKPKKQPQVVNTEASEEKPTGRKGTKREPKGKEPVIDPEELSVGEKELKLTPSWFFVQVKPSCENNVATSIRNLTQSIDGDDILDVLVPMTKTLKLSKGGASKEKDERYFPGYILVLMCMDRISYGHIKRIPHVQGFMGDPNDATMSKDQAFRPPIPVSNVEMRSIFEKIRDVDVKARQAKTGFQLNDVIRVVSGSMEGTKGRVVGVKPDLDVVNCRLMLFGRESLVELNIGQIEHYDEEKARLEDRQSRRADALEQNSNSDWRKRRVDSSFGKVGKVDYSSANVSSAADDLAKILLDDDDDSWDPLANVGGKSKKKRTLDQKDYQNEYAMDDIEADDAQGDEKEGFQDVFFLEDDDDKGGARSKNEFDFAERGKENPDELLDELEFGTPEGDDNLEGLVTSDRELDDFLRMESDADAAWAPELENDNDKRLENVQPRSSRKEIDSKSSKAPKSLEIDPELKLVLDEIDQELNQGESRNEGTKRPGPETTGRNSGVDFMESESDIEEEDEGDWLLDDIKFPFGMEGTEEDMSSAVDDTEGSSKTKKAKKKNKGQEVDPDSGDVLLSEFEKEFLTGLDDVGEEIVVLDSNEEVAQFDPSLLKAPKSDEEIVEEFKASRKTRGKKSTTGRRGRKRASDSPKQ